MSLKNSKRKARKERRGKRAKREIKEMMIQVKTLNNKKKMKHF